MKSTKKIGFLLAIAGLLAGCGNNPQTGSSSMTIESNWSSSIAENSSPMDESSEVAIKNGTYEFYCVNDYHGSVEERELSYYENGLKKYFSNLKAKKAADPDHTIIVSAGDMFQGSYESNSNYGQLVIETMNAVPFDGMAIGNHEFDYGRDRLAAAIAKADFPVMAGNIRNYTTREFWGESEISAVITRGAMKIGIVGMIGEGQTTSITSDRVRDLIFENPESYATEEATRLKTEENCDMVLLVLHDDASTIRAWSCANNLNDYFDAAFTGHSHSKNDAIIGGVPVVQSYCNGEYYSHISITYQDGMTSFTKGLAQVDKNQEVDLEISAVYDKYIKGEVETTRDLVAGRVTGTMNKSDVSRATCKGIYEELVGDYPDLVCVMNNSQRASLTGTVTYSDIYKATPFTNNIVIARVPGADILHEAAYALTYTGDVDRFGSITRSQKGLLVAVVDYVFYHMNEQKQYDYFTSLNENMDIVAEIGETGKYPADYLFRYIKDSCKGSLSASSCSGVENGFDLYR